MMVGVDDGATTKERKRSRKNLLADRYLSSIVVDHHPTKKKNGSHHTAKTELWSTNSDANSCFSQVEDDVFVDRPRAPRRAQHHPTAAATALTSPTRRGVGIRRDSKMTSINDNDEHVLSYDSKDENNISSDSNIKESTCGSFPQNPDGKTSSLDQAMEKGLEMIMSSTTCNSSEPSTLLRHNPDNGKQREIHQRKRHSTTPPIAPETKQKFQSVQKRFWDQRVGRVNAPSAQQKIAPPRQQPPAEPGSPTQSDITGAPTEIATNCAADVKIKRSATIESMESLFCLSPHDKAGKVSSNPEANNMPKNREESSLSVDLSLPSLDVGDLQPVMQRRTFTVPTEETQPPSRARSHQSPDPIFSSKSFQDSSTTLSTRSLGGVHEEIKVEDPPRQFVRTIGYEASPHLLSQHEKAVSDVATTKSSQMSLVAPPIETEGDDTASWDSNVAPILRIKSISSDAEISKKNLLPWKPNMAPIQRIKQFGNSSSGERRSITDTWNRKHTTPCKPSKAPTSLKEQIDEGASVGVRSIRSLFESGPNSGTNEHEEEEDTASVKSLRSVFEGKQIEAKDDASSVKSIRQVFETKNGEKVQDEVGKLRALFDSTTKNTSPNKNTSKFPPKSVATSASNTGSAHHLRPNSGIAGDDREMTPRGKRVVREFSSCTKSPSTYPQKRSSARVLGWWQDKTESVDASSRNEESLPSKVVNSSERSQQNSSNCQEECNQTQLDSNADISSALGSSQNYVPKRQEECNPKQIDTKGNVSSNSVPPQNISNLQEEYNEKQIDPKVNTSSSTSSSRHYGPTWMGHRDKVLSRRNGSIGHSFLSFGGAASYQDRSTSSSRKFHEDRRGPSSNSDHYVHQSPPEVVESSDSESGGSNFSDGVTLDVSIADVSVLTDPTGVASKAGNRGPLSGKISRKRSVDTGEDEEFPAKRSEASSSQPSEALAPLIARILRNSDDCSSTTKGKDTTLKRVWSQSSDWETNAFSSVGQSVACGYISLHDDAWDLNRVKSPSRSTGEPPLDVWEVFETSKSWLDEDGCESPLRFERFDTDLADGTPKIDADDEAQDDEPESQIDQPLMTDIQNDLNVSTPIKMPFENWTPFSPGHVGKITGSSSELPPEKSPRRHQSLFQLNGDQVDGCHRINDSCETNNSRPSLQLNLLDEAVLFQPKSPESHNTHSFSEGGTASGRTSLAARVAETLRRQRGIKKRSKVSSDTGVVNNASRFEAEVRSISTTPLSLVADAARRKTKTSKDKSPKTDTYADVHSEIEGAFPRTPPRSFIRDWDFGSSVSDEGYTSPTKNLRRLQAPVKSPSPTSIASTPTRANTATASRQNERGTVPDFPLFLLDLEEEYSSPQHYHAASVVSTSGSAHSQLSAPTAQSRMSPLRRIITRKRESLSYARSLVGVPGHGEAQVYLPKYAALRTRLRTLRASRLRRTVAKSGYIASPKGVIEEHVASQHREHKGFFVR